MFNWKKKQPPEPALPLSSDQEVAERVRKAAKELSAAVKEAVDLGLAVCISRPSSYGSKHSDMITAVEVTRTTNH